jgi:hypothetical protein
MTIRKGDEGNAAPVSRFSPSQVAREFDEPLGNVAFGSKLESTWEGIDDSPAALSRLR